MEKPENNHNSADIDIVVRKTAGLSRQMKLRHILMLNIGATIGTGLFLGSGYVLHTAGPLGAVLVYVAAGLAT